MKIKSLAISNTLSFLDRQEIIINKDFTIIIGPNGGGKTNFLDIVIYIIRRFFIIPWFSKQVLNGRGDLWDEWDKHEAQEVSSLEKHYNGRTKEQLIEINIEVTETDISNLKAIHSERHSAAAYSNENHRFPLLAPFRLESIGLKEGDIFNYVIKDMAIVDPYDTPCFYRSYLNCAEAYSRYFKSKDKLDFATPLLYLPVNRTSNGLISRISLSNGQESEKKKSVEVASSRRPGSIPEWALWKIGSKLRQFQGDEDGRAMERLLGEPSLRRFTMALAALGYKWNIKFIDLNSNQLDFLLEKQGSIFNSESASSGEKEIIVFLMAVFCLNVENSLVIIDEPELHLHPKWQKLLMEILLEIGSASNNQFIIATHSPCFITPNTLSYVTRFFSKNQQSAHSNFTGVDDINGRHILTIINSHNNEIIFFSDFVILVEGIIDKIVILELLQNKIKSKNIRKNIEVINVGGKSMFCNYEKILLSGKVRFAVIADLDYLKEKGSAEIKSLFTFSKKKFMQRVIDDPQSKDGLDLTDKIENAIKTGGTTELNTIYSYIKSRQVSITDDVLNHHEPAIIKEILLLKHSNNYLLTKGSIEKYLPEGCGSKDVDKLICLKESGDLLPFIETCQNSELSKIVNDIIEKV